MTLRTDPPIQQQRWDLFDSNEAFPSLRSVTLAFSRNSHAMVSSEREELLVWAVLREVFHRVKKSEEKRSGLGIPVSGQESGSKGPR